MEAISTNTAADRGANVVEFTHADDIIPLNTGVTLADADAAVIARRLRGKPWELRTRFFNNLICESIDNIGKMIVFAKTPEDGRRFLDWSGCEMMRRIGEVLDLWGETKPTNKDAAVLFFLSLNPVHRHTASMFLSTRAPKFQAGVHEQWEFIDGYVQKHWSTLAIFYRMTIAGNPAERAAWLAGPAECPEDWFDPSKLPIDGDDAAGDDAA